MKTQPTEAPKQARTPRGAKTPPSAAVCAALPLVAALAAGCPGVQVRPEPFTCPEGAVSAMRQLGWRDSDRFQVFADDRHDRGETWFRSGDTIVAVVPSQGITAEQRKSAPPGTRFLAGKVYVEPKSDPDDPANKGRVWVKYDRVKLPKGDELPGCFVAELRAVEVKDGAAKARNNTIVSAVDYWP